MRLAIGLISVLAVAASPVAQQQLLIQPSLDLSASHARDSMIDNGFRRISTSPDESLAEWMTEAQILGLIQKEVKFMDITDGDLEAVSSLSAPKKFAPPKTPGFHNVVQPLASNVSVPMLRSWLTEFTSFKTRYYQSTSGQKSSEWLHEQVIKVSKDASKYVKVKVTKFDHSWPQSSVLVRIEAADSSKTRSDDGEIVVISAHCDSVSQWNPWFGTSPGADDDGSGSVTIFEAYRVLIESGFVPGRPIEFHWYAAEEGGLLGSQKVVADYKKKGVQVAGNFHADMTGYQPPDKEEYIAVATDFVDAELTEFLRKLVEEYSSIKWINTSCGYACSDHASWTKAGYSSSFTFEALFDDHSPYIHTANDDVSHISFEHVAKFSEVAIAFAVELSLA